MPLLSDSYKDNPSLKHPHVAVLGCQIHRIELDFHLLRTPGSENEDRARHEDDQYLKIKRVLLFFRKFR